MRNLTFFIIWRYIWAKKSIQAANILMWGSALSAVVGVASLFLILSIYNGIEKNTYKHLAVICPDLKIVDKAGETLIRIDEADIQKIEKIEGVVYCSRTLRQEALMEAKGKKIVVDLIGVDTSFIHVTDLSPYIVNSHWNAGDTSSPLLTISYIAANQLLIDPDNMSEDILLSALRSDMSLFAVDFVANASSAFAAPYTAYYNVGNDPGSLPPVYTNIDFVRKLLHMRKGVYSALSIKVKSGADIDEIKKKISDAFPRLAVYNRYEQNQTYYNIIRTEKRMLTLVVAFMLLIALVGSIGTMRVLFIEKTNHAKVLYFLGLSYKRIRAKFFLQGFFINFLGLSIGLTLGIAIAISQQLFGWIRISSSLYNIPYDIDISIRDILFIIVGVATLNGLMAGIAMRGIGARIKNDPLRRF